MANVNKVFLIGRLTRDPETKYAPSGTAITEFGLAVNRVRRGQDGNTTEEVAYIEVATFGRQAETAREYLAKGRQVFVDGYLRFEQWTSQDGQKRNRLTVVADNLQFLDSRGGAPPPDQGGAPGGYSRPPATNRPATSYGESDFGGGGGPAGGRGGNYGSADGPDENSVPF